MMISDIALVLLLPSEVSWIFLCLFVGKLVVCSIKGIEKSEKFSTSLQFGLSVYYLQKKREALLKSEVKKILLAFNTKRKWDTLAEWTIDNKREAKEGLLISKGRKLSVCGTKPTSQTPRWINKENRKEMIWESE